MKKSVIVVLVAAITIALCTALVPNVLSQPENIEVLSYSWYISPYDSDELVVIIEVQNTGPNVIDYVMVTGTFYASDGTPLMSNTAKSFANQILPQQKTPFYLSLSLADYHNETIKNFTVSVIYADPTDSRQYQDLEITSHASSTDYSGYYIVTGVVENTGTQSTNKTWVVATFYNSTGSAVAVGYSDYLTPSSIAPGGTASFTIYPLDYGAVVDNISSYSLLVQTLITAPSPTPTPSISPSPSPSPTATPASPSPTPTENGTVIGDTYVYAAVAVVVIIIAIGVFALVRRKRGGKRAVR